MKTKIKKQRSYWPLKHKLLNINANMKLELRTLPWPTDTNHRPCHYHANVPCGYVLNVLHVCVCVRVLVLACVCVCVWVWVCGCVCVGVVVFIATQVLKQNN